MPKKLPTFKNIVNIVLRGFLPLIDYHMQSLKYNGNIFNNVIESAIIVIQNKSVIAIDRKSFFLNNNKYQIQGEGGSNGK
jgi:hypothetical protein